MKRLIVMLAAVAAAASPLAVDYANAQGRGHGRGEARADRDGGDRSRGGEARGAWRRGETRPGGYERRGDERRGPRYEDRDGRARFEDDGRRPHARRRGDEDRRQYAPAPEDVAPRGRSRTIRPGGYLPPDYRGAPVHDFQRYRLRPPPHGYAWVRSGNAFLLVSLIDGQVFDVVVD
jgi:Ni/Co efflux regulator RcnB